MPEGKYSAQEREILDAMAKRVISGELTPGQAVDALVGQLHRSPKGIRLFLGRTISRLNGSGGRSRRRGRRRGSAALEGLAVDARDVADELKELKKKRHAIDVKIAETEQRLAVLKGKLLHLIGVEEEDQAAGSEE